MTTGCLQDDLSLGQSVVCLRSLLTYFIIQSEPKILRLVTLRGAGCDTVSLGWCWWSHGSQSHMSQSVTSGLVTHGASVAHFPRWSAHTVWIVSGASTLVDVRSDWRLTMGYYDSLSLG